MPMLPSPICPLAGQSIFGQNVVCGSMTHLPSARSTEECHLIRSFFQVLCFDHRLAYTYLAPQGEKEHTKSPPAEPTSIRPIWRFVIKIADEINQICMPKHLAYRHVLARVIPVMIDHALHKVAKAGCPITSRAAKHLL